MTKVEFEPGPCNYSFFISPLSSEEVGAHCGGHINSNSAGSAHGLCQLPPTLISCPRHSAQPFLLVVLFAENPRLWELRGTSEVPWSPSCSILRGPLEVSRTDIVSSFLRRGNVFRRAVLGCLFAPPVLLPCFSVPQEAARAGLS